MATATADSELKVKIGQDDFLHYLCGGPVVFLLVRRNSVPLLSRAAAALGFLERPQGLREGMRWVRQSCMCWCL